MTIKEIQNKLNKDIKRYKTLSEINRDQEYKLAYSMISNYLKELLEEIKK